MSSNPGETYDDQLRNAIKVTLNTEHGRLALAWAMNLVPNLEPKAETGFSDSAYDTNVPISERQEGFRSAGQQSLRVIRLEHPSKYATLMTEVIRLQTRLDAPMIEFAEKQQALDTDTTERLDT